ncbi:MAG TPA: helix-hairpin-helix domain-containing protein [Solirubrobacterales bacterium]|nr:helix-hairpin-helix domain-containing protein [Solirubrobacterales bacterium]
MAAPGNKSARSADEWLLNGSDQDESGGLKTSRAGAQWLVEPATELNGEKAATEPPPPAKDEKPAPKPERADEKALDELRAENRDLAEQVRELETEIAAQAKRAQAELATSFDQREAELSARIDELESALADAKERAQAPSVAGEGKSTTTRRPSRKKGVPDLNEASFEELRNLGLSVTQSARVIAYRDVRGGYQSLDELDEIPGLPKETRMDLRKKLTLST